MGRVIANRYLIEGVVDETSASTYYRAYHLGLDRTLLMRLMPARSGLSSAACQRALQVGHRLSRLEAPQVLRTLDVGWYRDHFPFSVSERLAGPSLDTVLRTEGPLDPARVVRIGRQLASTLQQAHAMGITHGGLGLDCLFLDGEAPNGFPSVKLLGFGVSELPPADGDGPKSGIFHNGTGGELADAAFRAALRGDVYALGESLYRLAAGRPPDWASDMLASGWAAEGDAPPSSGAPKTLQALGSCLRRALYLDPSNGYDHVAQLARDLGRVEAELAPDGPVTAVQVPRPPTVSQPPAAKVIVRSG